MSEENVEFVAGIFNTAEGMDKEALLAALPDLVPQLCDPDVEWIEDPQRADSRTYRGHAGVIESWRQWLETFGEWGFEIERITDCGGGDVLVETREHGTGALSEAPVGATNYAVITVKDGKIRRYREFYDEAAALPSRRAAGVGDESSETHACRSRDRGWCGGWVGPRNRRRRDHRRSARTGGRGGVWWAGRLALDPEPCVAKAIPSKPGLRAYALTSHPCTT